MKNKMWDGRFSKETDSIVNDYNSSISFDSRMYNQDIRGSIAHASMLCNNGIITKFESEQIINGLIEIQNELENGSLSIDPNAEDIHMFIEAQLTKKIGDPGKKLHTGRSRNDQVALDIKLYLKEDIKEISSLIVSFCNVLLDLSDENIQTIMPGYTHLQRAQPITLAHHLMAYVQMFLRDLSRLVDCFNRMDTMPLGSGALAGTTYPIDRVEVTKSLGFSSPTKNSIDGVSDRDHVIELASALSIFMIHISRLSEEIILWASSEFSFIELDDAFSTGSSIMPQKKNPDVAELSRGKSGRVFGNLMTLLTIMKGIPLAYNKDMQEDKEAIFDSSDTVKMTLKAFTGMMKTISICSENMAKAAQKGFLNATDLADYLVRKGITFRDSHEISGKIVANCIAQNISLDELSISEYKKFSPLIEKDLYEAISLNSCVNGRNLIGGPAFETVKKEIKAARQELEKYSSIEG